MVREYSEACLGDFYFGGKRFSCGSHGCLVLLVEASLYVRLTGSIPDCACLATAQVFGLEVLTAEQDWARISNLRITVRLIRTTRT